MSDSFIEHYGRQTKSGRYPWGSGARPYQRLERWGGDILSAIDELGAGGATSDADIAQLLDMNLHEFYDEKASAIIFKKLEKWDGDLLVAVADLQGQQKMTNAQAARELGMRTRELIARKQAAKNLKRAEDAPRAIRLREAGHSYQAIADMMGYKNESNIRALLAPSENQKLNALQNTRDVVKRRVDERTYVDVGKGNEVYLGVSPEKLEAAIQMLVDDGYNLYKLEQRQLTNPGNYTHVMVLTKPEIPFAGTDDSLVKNKDKIALLVGEYSEDRGQSFLGIKPPAVVSRDRVLVRYGDEGGSDRDGTLELREGVKDITLNGASYAQVRVAVGDGDMFMKGIAYYSNAKFPPGVDIIYNSNKPKGTPDAGKGAVFKSAKDDPENPFGSDIRQFNYTDANGVSQLSALNIVRQEGAWDNFAKNFSSQFLAKQSVELIEQQLGKDKAARIEDLNTIASLTNPQVKKMLLLEYASECDSASVNLKVAALSGTANKVLLPAPDLKPNEIYAPHLNNGDHVALVRHPHAGPFEIPELIVNNNNRKVRNQLGLNPIDMVGVHPQTAAKLSGADFDGDHVLVIPNNDGLIKSKSTLKGLENFDPHIQFAGYEGMTPFKDTQKQMGTVSNLISDMTAMGATNDELARAVRHSMVTIDAEKHNLDWKQSYNYNGIAALHAKYQPEGGTSTIFTRAKGEARIPHQTPRAAKDGGPIDVNTGKLVFTPTGESYVDKSGNPVSRVTVTTQMRTVDDARLLMSGPNHEGTPKEIAYANYANTMKQLANDARKLAVQQPNIVMNRTASKVYANEVASIDAKIRVSKMSAPLERVAQVRAGAVVGEKIKASPTKLPKKEVSKISGMALREARARVGKEKTVANITDKEWEAIQAGAVSNHKLNEFLRIADSTRIKELATPREKPSMDASKIARARSMLNSGRTLAEVARALGVSVSTITNNI